MYVRIYLDLHTSRTQVELIIQLILFAGFTHNYSNWRTIYILSPGFVAAAVATTSTYNIFALDCVVVWT
jgi:hypothetical protein